MSKATGRKAARWLSAAALLALPLQVLAAPSNVVIVAKSGGNYADPITAMNNISGATSSNRYLVKIMPGEYDLGTSSLQMRQYIDVEGSGSDNTVIISSNVSTDAVCDVGTVQMAEDSTIKNIKIVNNPPLETGAEMANALVFNSVKAKAEGVGVQIGNDADYPVYRNVGVCIGGADANAILNNMYIDAHNFATSGNSSQANAVRVTDGAKLLLTNSRLVSVNYADEAKLIGSMSDDIGSITVMNTKFEVTAGRRAEPFFIAAFDTLIMDSVVTINVSNPASSDPSLAFRHNNTSDLRISGTKFFSNVPVSYGVYEGTTRIDHSLLPGDYSSLQNNPNVKLVCNFDETYTPIPNQ